MNTPSKKNLVIIATQWKTRESICEYSTLGRPRGRVNEASFVIGIWWSSSVSWDSLHKYLPGNPFGGFARFLLHISLLFLQQFAHPSPFRQASLHLKYLSCTCPEIKGSYSIIFFLRRTFNVFVWSNYFSINNIEDFQNHFFSSLQRKLTRFISRLFEQFSSRYPRVIILSNYPAEPLFYARLISSATLLFPLTPLATRSLIYWQQVRITLLASVTWGHACWHPAK